MIIESIKLKNYRQFKEENIALSKDKKNKNFTVIQGSNGSGKSNIFNAINWCIYGKEVHLTKQDKMLPLLNTVVLKEKFPKEVVVEVEIKLRDNEGKAIIISRKKKFYESSEGNIRHLPDEVNTFMQIKNNMGTVNSDFIRGKLMPESIREYFFFDGERLDDYFRKEGAQSIKKSVFEISQIELLEKAIKHLDIKSDDFLKEDKNLSPQAERIRKELESLQKGKEELEKDLEEKEKSLKEAKLNSQKIFEDIKKNPVLNSEELKKQKIELDEVIKYCKTETEELESNFQEELLSLSPKILLYDSLKHLQKVISNKVKEKQFPPGIDGDFLKELLKSKECICGRKISNKDKSKDKLENILEIYNKLSTVGNKLSECQTDMEVMLSQIPSFKKIYLDFEKRKKEIEKKREKSSKDLKIIDDKLADSDDSFAELQRDLNEKNEEIENTSEDVGKFKLSLEGSEGQIKLKQEELEKELKKEKRFDVLRKKLDFCKESLKECERIKKEIMEETKKDIEIKTKKQFFDLIWNPKDFKDIKIDDDYNLSVVHSSGLESLGSLSAGQRQVLALSFIAALNSISGFDLPIIIDTPLGRISKKTRSNIAEKLPHFLKEKQVLLLVTDEEYTIDVRKRLEKNVGKQYEIKLTEYTNGGISKVIET